MRPDNETFSKIVKAIRISSFVSLVGLFIVIASIVYATYNLKKFQDQAEKKKTEVTTLGELVKNLTATQEAREDKIRNISVTQKALEDKIRNLTETQKDILDFLSSVTKTGNVRFIDSSVDWIKVQDKLIDLKPGKRKQAIFGAILLAWKEIPFQLSQESLHRGFDSPRFVEFVLSQVGIKIKKEHRIPLSLAMMGQFRKVTSPMPGDLMFYKGHIGNFVFIYLAEGDSSGHGIGIGVVETRHPMIITDTSMINPIFPFIGYFRPNYPDEQ